MDETSNKGRHKTKEPILPALTASDAACQIIADPTCRRPGCYGRGYYAVNVLKDGTPQLVLCKCASYGETDFVKMVLKMEAFVHNQTKAIREDILALEHSLERITILGIIRRIIIKRRAKKECKAIPGNSNK